MELLAVLVVAKAALVVVAHQIMPLVQRVKEIKAVVEASRVMLEVAVVGKVLLVETLLEQLLEMVVLV
jgi:hypothetical protein